MAWTAACQSKDEGGLRILNLKAHNKALLLKFADKFYNFCDIPWVRLAPHFRRIVGSFWWRDVMRLSLDFLGMASCVVGFGASVSLREDMLNFGLLKLEFPQFYYFARDQKLLVVVFLTRSIEEKFSLSPFCRSFEATI